ncbi:hypothetical protein NE237_027524 [Protea cynaroides]|uniref:Xyloglucan endotransglucosylase/hydrolase n=1 Tax=Protea cynaroides TaxID=273540 RepID=A0A9Q0GMP1_9MAGN|nr:hypothetical protein NE237_027524 [Protea cynaroides]
MGVLRRLRCSLSFLLSLAFISIARAALNVTTIPFQEGYSPLFSDFNIHPSPDGKSVNLNLNRYSGSGFVSSNLYNHGFYSADIKLPADYTAGVVVAFYTSNQDVFEKTHDELDIEFLGNVRGKEWRFQTNLYGNGSTNRGREERYFLWFDPTQDYHRYSILWTHQNVIFYVDDVPIREVVRSDDMGGDYPSKPMALYATIWDASNWATSGGKYKVNYKYEPFVAGFRDLSLQGCAVDPIEQIPNAECSEQTFELENADYAVVTPARRLPMNKFRQTYMYYSYCYDTVRYPIPPSECVVDPVLKKRFNNVGRVPNFSTRRRRQAKKSRVSSSNRFQNQVDV